jgi:putative phosphoribosyl transferase
MILELIAGKFQFKFKDRVNAASILGESLKDKIKAQERRTAVVLGIPRGGVITADVVAKKLSCKFDIIIPRKLTDPDNKEHAIGAIMEDGTAYVDEELINLLQISPDYLEKEKLEQIAEIKRRTSMYVGDTFAREDNLDNKTVILVDDGAATGATIIVAARSIRKRFRPKMLIIALPVAPRKTVNLLKQEADVVEVITSPSGNFRAVGQYYQEFNPVSDEQVIKIMYDWTISPTRV